MRWTDLVVAWMLVCVLVLVAGFGRALWRENIRPALHRNRRKGSRLPIRFFEGME